MEVTGTKRIDTVTITMTREELYQLNRIVHSNIELVRGVHPAYAGVTPQDLSNVRNMVNSVYTRAEDLFGEE